ncbi:MAG: hypothetical protein KZY74_13940 [Paenibacillaceae bacterium]|uniref:Uncharacterized protein n=1 Tax=Paenibacillus mellifer TaxID=2937794 RepID=A0A9X1Y4H5_9BACL|nr:hypothetical protein [Paenibacillus mellifer]MBW4840491.1 hypothetical protein [Paenibacillaceae bacterium]MCK8489263.1 hypothetical protein [Paenibacillus mellifer]
MTGRARAEERTGFQEGSNYSASYDLQADFVMVYGIGETMPQRIREWAERGYRVHLMTGVSWGGYQDYLNGKTDGRPHWDEAQKYQDGEMIIHGTSVDIPYMVPTISYADFLVERIRPAVDAGVEAIHLEEPEFWVEGGYSEAFQREWQNYYNEPWQPPHSSEDAQYRASKLKAYLYTRCLDRICSALKEYSLVRYNRPLRFFVPTHSLINYTQWRIVSPESRLLDVPTIDGYIAQIWTGTSRTANVYEGKRAERTFETSFLEYGIMQELVRGTHRRMWFLHDPIEDDPTRTWADYRENYVKTLIASLLHPAVSRYEVAPWPRRIFKGSYPSADGNDKEGIPAEYGTMLLNVMHTLGNMEQEEVRVFGNAAVTGVLLADSAMFQRKRIGTVSSGFMLKYDGTNEVKLTDESAVELLNFSAFYGLTLPLVKHGLPVRPVQLDNVRRFPGYLDDYRVLVLSYEFMKPESPDLHGVLAQWVREGGALIYVGDDSDPYHGVREWWNQGRRHYVSPRAHLFESLGLPGESKANTEGITRVGAGLISYLPMRPDRIAESEAAATRFRNAVREAMKVLGSMKGVADTGHSTQHAVSDKRLGGPPLVDALCWEPKNYFHLRRGPYVIASVMTESISETPLELEGQFVNLLDAGLPVIERVNVQPGRQALLYDLIHIGPGGLANNSGLIAASSRIEDYQEDERGVTFIAKGPRPLQAVARIRCDARPAAVSAEELDYGKGEGRALPALTPFEWDARSRTLLIHYEHGDGGTRITVTK